MVFLQKLVVRGLVSTGDYLQTLHQGWLGGRFVLESWRGHHHGEVKVFAKLVQQALGAMPDAAVHCTMNELAPRH